MELALVYTTFDDKMKMEEILSYLMSSHLIACANIFPMNSMYEWDKNIVNSAEFGVLLKTSPNNSLKVKAYLEQNHPYKIPCIMELTANANEKYSQWIYDQCK